MLRVPHLARLTDFICTCMFKSCVEWGSTNTGWHINVHHMKTLYTHMKCEVKTQWGYGNGAFMAYNGSGTNGLMGGAFMAYNGWGIYDLRVWLWLKWMGQL